MSPRGLLKDDGDIIDKFLVCCVPQHNGDTKDHFEFVVSLQGLLQQDGDTMEHFLVFCITARSSAAGW